MFGGTVVVLDRFHPTTALAAIERFQITHSQWVPTMFIRLLHLPEEVKTAYDLSSHRVAIHAAAPCPPAIKHEMMDWWGPILYEYYAGSEGFGRTAIGPEEWLAHPGSVGKADPAVIFILDEDNNELPPGESGLIHFNPITTFEYKGDAEKTAGAMSPQGYATYGDVGYVDDDGYLFLTDRKSFMIISGGVNIYPRETEDVLIAHPAILDAAVFGVPHPDLGEEVKAAVELQPGFEPSDELAADIIAFSRDRLSSFKCPRSVDFSDALPRLPTGKLRKADLRAPYWG
jgi:fatty-acyl-CoA synthase